MTADHHDRRDPAPSAAKVGRRALLRSATAGGAVLGAAACARIPASSGIGSVPVGVAQGGTAPYVQPRPPSPGASPAQIVAGFVQAGVGADDDYAVARSYLAPKARAAWDPSASVTVYAGAQGISTVERAAGEIALGVEAVGQVDGMGVRTVLASPSQRSIDVQLEQVDGQWRIATPPAGILLSEQVFEILFTPGRLYFLGSRERHLVPDVRWVPSREQAVTLLRHLGGGPAPFLEGAVHSAVPSALATEPATVGATDSGRVRIEVPVAVARLRSDRRGAAVAQILASIRSLSLLGDVDALSDGGLLAVPADLAIARPLEGHRALAAAGTGIVALADDPAGNPPVQLVPALAGDALRGPSLSADSAIAAALRPDRSALVIAATAPDAGVREVAGGQILLAPSIDDLGRVWTAPRTGAGGLLVLSSGGPAEDVVVDVPWLEGRELVSLDLSADATRLIVVSALDDEHRLDLCAVVREPSGAPRGVTEPVLVITTMPILRQATWYDEASVLVLGEMPDGAPRGALVELAGAVEQLPVLPAGTVHLAGTALSGVSYAADDEGALHRTDGATWAPIAATGRDPSFF